MTPSPRAVRVSVPLLLLAALGACSSNDGTSGVGAACTRTSDCQSGLLCAPTGLCTPPDAGVPEGGGGPGDSSSLDARSAG